MDDHYHEQHQNDYYYNPGHGPFHGTPAERAAYARQELGATFVASDDVTLNAGYDSTDQQDIYVDSDKMEEMGESYSRFQENGNDVNYEDDDEEADPAYLFALLEEALPTQTEMATAAKGRTPTMTEQQQKRDQVEHTWDRVRRWLWSHPHEDERRAAAYIRGQADATSLHLMCKLQNPPDDVILALVEAAADTVSWTDSHGWLPLHHACANGASPEVIKILIDAYPEGKIHQDTQSRTPLHFYVTRGSVDNVASMTVNAQLLSDTGAAALADRAGMLPMHYACAYGSHPAVLEVLGNVYPESLTAKEDNGRTPMHLAMVNAHRAASPNTLAFLLSSEEARSTINTRDRDGFLPLHLLALGLKGYRVEDPEKQMNVSEALSMYLAAEPFPTADFLTAIQDLPEWLQDTAVVSKHVRNVLNDKIVKRFPTSMLLMDGYMLIILIVCFAITTTNHIDLRFDPLNTTNHSQGALIIVFICATYFFIRELVQVVSLWTLGSISRWWKDLSNWLDTAVIVLVYYYAALMASGGAAISDEAFRSGVAFTQGLLWAAIIMFLKRALVDFAVFVGGVVYVVQRLAAFLLAVGVILLGFAQMFYFVYVDTAICNPEDVPVEYRDCRFPHCTFEESLLKVYSMMMGEIGDENRYSTSVTAQFLYVFYAFLVVILLSNVLIAIVTDSYEFIQNDRAAIVFWSNRLDFVAEMDAISYAVLRRIQCCGADKKLDASPSVYEVKEGPSSKSSLEINGHTDETDTMEEMNGSYFREAWHQVWLLFDANLYDEIDWIEALVYNFFRVICIFLIIPLWLTAGLLTAGWLWPPQVRVYLFVQKGTTISRAERERKKLEQLKRIQDDLKHLRQEIKNEMESDRDEMSRMRTEVETIQSEVLGDLQQVRELMSSLLRE